MKVLSNFSKTARGHEWHWLAEKQDFTTVPYCNIETPRLIGKVMAALLGDVL